MPRRTHFQSGQRWPSNICRQRFDAQAVGIVDAVENMFFDIRLSLGRAQTVPSV